ncbi:methyl-accepting chemotaxis protein [Lysinibacillus sp. LZ02]|uniref:methyl-accepting chemotaxis protein n=1 Tax=Lysinibacillus sp. LZ02 TaxID=3420668 RepID=UPI003D364F26
MKTTVKQKLFLSFGVVLGLMLIISTISLYFLNNNKATLTDIQKDSELITLYDDISFQAVRANAAIRGYMLYGNDQMLSNHYEIRQTLHQSADRIDELGYGNADYDQFIIQLTEWETAIDNEIIPTYQAGDTDKAYAISVPILGQGSQNLVVFGKSMSTAVNEELLTKIGDTTARSNTIILQIGVLALLSLIIGIAISSIFGRRVAQNVNTLSDKMREFAQGNLNTELSFKTKDEFASLASSFNQMGTDLTFSMKGISNASEQVAATSQELTASSYEVTQSTELVTNAMQEITSKIEQQDHYTKDLKHLSEHIVKKMEDITTSIHSVNESTSNTQTLSNESYHSIDAVTTQMDTISENTQLLNSRISDLDENAEAITTAVQVIKSIAEQTNLLALNAAIEAARSGEHGKGFAVVAEEVRKLADESHVAAIQIEKVVAQITESTRLIEEDITENSQSVDVGLEKVSTARTNFISISDAIHNVTEQTAAVTKAVQVIYTDVESLVKEIDLIAKLSIESNENVQSIAAASEEQMAAMEEVSASSSHLAKMAQDLQQTIQQFKY